MVMNELFSTYTTTSQKLGLTFADGRIVGTLDGIAVQMTFGAHSVQVAAFLPAPAPFELSIAARGLVDKLADFFGSHAQGIGDAAFDAVFVVKTASPEKLGALLGSDAKQALLDAAKADLHPSVDAHAAHTRRFSYSAVTDAPETIERDFREAVRIAKAVAASFAPK
jgi:hypothetical protein